MGLTVTTKPAAPPPEVDKKASASKPKTGIAAKGKSDVSTKAAEIKQEAAGKPAAPASAQSSVPAADTQSKALGQTTTETKASGAVTSDTATLDAVEGGQFLGASTPPQALAEVGCEVSFTHNKGNYESIKVGVSLRLPCEVAKINEAYDYATAWSSQRLNQALIEIGAQPAPEAEA